jgi:hypothetical protein
MKSRKPSKRPSKQERPTKADKVRQRMERIAAKHADLMRRLAKS